MQSALPVALSAQVTLQRRLDTVADNLANAATPGHLATKVRFEAAVERHGGPDVAFAREGDVYLSTARGAHRPTGAPLDFAVRGEAWFGIDTPAGTVLTRDGRFTMALDGALVTLEGHAVLGPGGAPVTLDPGGGAPIAGADGSLRQGEGAEARIVGSIGLFEIDAGAETRFGNSGVLAPEPPRPVVNRTDVGVLQGVLEDSNAGGIEQMVRLVEITRGFEAVSQLVQRADGGLSDALRELAAR